MKKELLFSKLTESFKIQLTDEISIVETYENKVLINQYFTKTNIPFFYHYKPQISELLKKTHPQESNLYVDDILIYDLETFNDFDNVVCLRGNTNNTIWKIKEDKPISVIMYIDDIDFNYCGINDLNYNIDEIIKKSKSISYIDSISKYDIPRYNQINDEEQAIQMYVFFTQEDFETFLIPDKTNIYSIDKDKIFQKVLKDLDLKIVKY